jgi:prepilin-type N-terminal cleavage/methylation domain-containing protein
MRPSSSPTCSPSLRAVKASRGECGYTLIELLVVVALLAVVVGTLMAPLVTTQRAQTRDANYAAAQQEARTGLDGMVSQVRQAWAILSTGPNSVEMNVNLGGTAEHVYYECDIPQTGTSYRECVRVQSLAGNPLPALASGAIVVRNLTNGTDTDPVFSFGPDPVSPYYMTATVKVPASGGVSGGLTHSIVFSDGALMRNQNVGN